MTKNEKSFVDTVWDHYRKQGRHALPWRKTTDPYRVLVSEIMCQQTQVERVVPKYKAFIKSFPTVAVLAEAPRGAVLRMWQGLGYNRRAKYLHQCARQIVELHNGAVPKNFKELTKLSGIGPYTAGAIMAFSYNKPVPIIETNIRTVYLHHFFRNERNVSDNEIVRYIVLTMDSENPREWFAALMDYGSHIKSEFGNQNVRSSAYTKQSKFKGSDREIRGLILRVLSDKGYTAPKLLSTLEFSSEKLLLQLQKLCQEELIEKKGSVYQLPSA